MHSFRPASLLVAAAVAVLSAGCTDDPVDPPLAPSIAPATQWAGGIVRVTLDGIGAGEAAPPLTLGGEPLAAVEVGAGWVDYRLPGTARGPVSLELGGDDPAVFEIEVLGFRGAQSLGVALRGNLFVWPRGGDASILGLASDNSGVIQVLAASAQTQYLIEEPVFSEARSVGPTSDPDVLLIPKGNAEIWRLLPTRQVVDTLNVQFSRHAMLLSDSVYVFSGHHDISVVDPRVGWPSSYIAQYEESQGAVVSPSGRFGAFRINGSRWGPPVFSGESGQPVFHVETLSHSDGVDFSPFGDTLYITGTRSTEPRHHLVLSIDATTGEIVHSVEIAELNPLNLLRDPHGPWLFVMVLRLGDAAAPPSLLVIDTRTMEIVGQMVTEGYTGCAAYGCEGAIAVGPGGVFFVSTNSTPAAARDVPAVVLAFDGWPAQ